MGSVIAAGPQLRVGDPSRRVIGRAVLGSLWLAALFVASAVAAKELPALYVHEPWQDDPYDAVVSFAIFFVPVLAALCALRAPLCRRKAPLPVRRASDLLRASRVLVAVVLVTLAGDWISVALQAQRSAWSVATVVALGGLAAVSVASIAVARELRRAFRVPLGAVPGPDWLADAITLAERAAARLGVLRPFALRTVRWIDCQILARIRRYPLTAAGVLSLAFGAALATSQSVQEGYVASGFLLVLAVAATSMFAFLAIVGAHLGLTGDARRPAGRVTHAGVAACVSVPITLAFRAAVWSLLGFHGQPGWLGLMLLMLVVATGAGVVAFAGGPLRRRLLPR
jgi:hypothetical protein